MVINIFYTHRTALVYDRIIEHHQLIIHNNSIEMLPHQRFLAITILGAAGIIIGVHEQQKQEKVEMHQGVLHDKERRQAKFARLRKERDEKAALAFSEEKES